MQRKVLAVVTMAIIVGSTSAVQAQPQLTMKLTSATGNDPSYEWQKMVKAGVESRTGGQLKIDLYNFNQLGPIPRQVEGVVLGTIECSTGAAGFLTGVDRRFQALDFPGIAEDLPKAIKKFTDPAVRARILRFGAEKGVETIGTAPAFPVGIVSRWPIRTLAEFKGKKIRTPPSPAYLEPIKFVGATPTPMDIAEVPGALQTGTIDGSLSGSLVFTALKYYDAAKYVTILPEWRVAIAVICNKAWISSLPADFRTILLEEAAKADAALVHLERAIADARKEWEHNGGQYIFLSAGDQKAFVEGVKEALARHLAANAELKATVELLVAAGR
jgi:TRAP-type transport system periplasmic protein